MTIQSTEHILKSTYNSAISYSLELLEAEDSPMEILDLVKEFL